MISRHHGAEGFSLVELSVATAILVVGLAMGLTGLVYFINESREAQVQDELDIDVQTSMEKIKYDLRLSSLDHVFYSPATAAVHRAISFPMARDDDGDGALEVDANGKIIWDRTMIYHVWSGTPNRLLLSIFDPRDNTLTDQQRQAQVDNVLAAGNVSGWPGGNSRTYTVFENLFEWSLRPSASLYDAYAPAMQRDTQAYLGSALLTPGNHTLRFQVAGKNTASSNYRMGFDTLILSSSYSEREAETLLPVIAQSGATAASVYMEGGSWSGNYQLYFPSTTVGHSVDVQLYNDEWIETNFSGTGSKHERTEVVFDTVLNPSEYTVQLRGMRYDWEATVQSGDSTGGSSGPGAMSSKAVRVLVRGSQMTGGGAIRFEGARSWVLFTAGQGAGASLKIESAFIAECAGTTNASMNAVSGTFVPLLFSGNAGTTILAGTARWSDICNMTIRPQKSYLISYRVNSGATEGSAYEWRQAPGMTGAYMVAITSGVPASVVSDVTWSTRSDVKQTNALCGVQAIYATYPTNGMFTSRIYDTQMTAPAYSAINWSVTTPSGTALKMKTRTAADAEMLGAPAWSNVTVTASPGVFGGGTGRYVQFQTTLESDASRYNAPKLQSVAIRWPGQARIVNVGGTITKGPNYGMFKTFLDGQPMKSGIVLDLKIYKDVRVHGAVKRVTSALSTEIVPRNTGH